MEEKKDLRQSHMPGGNENEGFAAQFRQFMTARVRSSVELRYMLRYTFLLLLPILAIIYAITTITISGYETESRTRMYMTMDNVLSDLDAELVHLANTTMQAAVNPIFQNAHTKDLPASFDSIRDTLLNIAAGNRLFQHENVAFYSATTPQLFYTGMGTFNDQYFRYYALENGTIVSMRTMLENTEYMRMIPYDATHTYYDAPASLDVIYALQGQKGSFMIYSIPEEKVRQLLALDAYMPESVFLLHKNGYKLFPLDHEVSPEQELITELAASEEIHGSRKLSGGRELFVTKSDHYDLALAYVMPVDKLNGKVRSLSLLLYGSIVIVGILGAILITVLTYWNAMPIREILFLTERLSPTTEANQDEAALDRIRSILIQLYSDRSIPAAQQETKKEAPPVLHESLDADLLMKPETTEEVQQNQKDIHQCESALVRRVLAFVDEHDADAALNVNMVADAFEMEPSNLSHQFRNWTGYALSDYLNARKLDVACARLRDTRLSVAAIAESLGYAHASSFIRMFKKVYGITPTQFRNEALSGSSHDGIDENSHTDMKGQ